MPSQSARFDSKLVLDANGEAVGTVIGSELSDGTREPTSILVELSDDAAEHFGAGEATLWLSYEQIRSIRRGEVTLGETMHELTTANVPATTPVASFSATRLPDLSSVEPDTAEA